MGTFLRLFAVAALLSGVTYPPQERPDAQKPLQYEVTVSLKLIQVYVTDKDGKPVTDLTKDDFTVLDNGQPVAITEFEKHELQPAPEENRRPAEAETLIETPVETRALNRRFILFFDFAFNSQKGVVAGVQAALHFLDTQVLPGDEVALFSYSMIKGLKVHEYFATDHDKVREAVTKITGKEISGRAEEVEQAYWQLASIADDGPPPDQNFRVALNKIEGQRRDSQLQVRNYFLNLASAAKALRLVPGQKNILFFSTGIPYSLIYSGRVAGSGIGNVRSTAQSQFELGESTLQPLQESMLKEFSASNCSFYAFDTRESSKLSSLFAYDEMQFETGLGGMFSADGVRRSTSSPLRDDKTTGQDTLRRLSKQTGGQYFSNITFYEESLDKVQDITGAYYVIGYAISTAPDGEFRNIKVSVKRKGCQVRTQSGYFNPKPFRDFSKIEKELQLFDLALNERSDLQAPKRLSMTALSYDAGEGTRLRTISKIPKDTLDAFGGKTAEFVALFFDEKDNLASLQRATVKLADYRGKELLFSSGIAPQPGQYKCRLVIRDLDTGQSAVASSAVNIAKRGPSTLVLGSPLMLVEGGRLGCIEGKTRERSDSLSWRDIYPFDEARFTPVLGEIPAGRGKVTVVVPMTTLLPDETGLAFSASLVNADSGAALHVPFQLMNRARLRNIVLSFLEFPLDLVPEGKYLIYIHAGDKATGALANTRTSFSVRAGS